MTGSVSHQVLHNHSAHLPGQEGTTLFLQPKDIEKRNRNTRQREQQLDPCSTEGREGEVRAEKIRDEESGGGSSQCPVMGGSEIRGQVTSKGMTIASVVLYQMGGTRWER